MGAIRGEIKMFKLAKVYIRSIVGIITMGVVTAYLGDPSVLTQMYVAIGVVVYLDKSVSGDPEIKTN